MLIARTPERILQIAEGLLNEWGMAVEGFDFQRTSNLEIESLRVSLTIPTGKQRCYTTARMTIVRCLRAVLPGYVQCNWVGLVLHFSSAGPHPYTCAYPPGLKP